MKRLAPKLLLLLLSFGLHAQNNSSYQILRHGSSPLLKTLHFSDPALTDFDPYLLTVKEQPKPASDYGNKKDHLRQMRLQHNAPNLPQSRSQSAAEPAVLNNFTANNAQGTPNDNHIAVSNTEQVVSVVNTNFRVYNKQGTQMLGKSLASFAFSLGVLQAISDPRVIYDPIEDRYIIVFFSGTTSATTKIIVAFSQSNDATQTWNFYSLNGNPLNDSTWSDYPIVTISDKDLFLTFNHLKDGEGWKTGFRYSAIWQIDKEKGYNGDTLAYNFFHHVSYNGKPVWSICPVQGGSAPSGPETYLLSVRPSDLSNDTVFLHTISDSYQSGNAALTTKVLRSDIPYGLPPDGRQKDGQFLATNDARVLCGFFENNQIQFVQNSSAPGAVTAAVYHGAIDGVSSSNPTVTGTYLSNDTIDFGYPSIAYVGNSAFDRRALITCSYASPDTFPGTVVFYRDAQGNFSDMKIIKQGERALDVLQDSTERWGDYTGIQRMYNEPNAAWLAGSYVFPSQAYRTWIAKVVNSDSALVSSVSENRPDAKPVVFPNPADERFSVSLEVPSDNFIRSAIFDLSGRLISVLQEDHYKAGKAVFSFRTAVLPNGTYILELTNMGKILVREKVVVQH